MSEGLPRPWRWGRCRSPGSQAGPGVAARPEETTSLAWDPGAWADTLGTLGKASWENSPSIRTDSGVDIMGGWEARAWQPFREGQGLDFDPCHCPLTLALASATFRLDLVRTF